MLKRFLILPVALALTLGLASVAQGTKVSETVKGNATPVKHDKKKRGGVSIRVDTDTIYTSYGPPPDPTSHTERAVIHFDNDFAFNAGNLPQCAQASIENTPTEVAKQVCASSQVGAGGGLTNGVLGPIPAVVTAFNGAPQSGRQVILLHARVGPPINSTTILVGVLKPSELGGDYGMQLDVDENPLAGGFQVITHFDTTIPKRVVKKKVKKNKKTGKKKVTKTFYVSARCKDKNKTWNYAADFYAVDNPGGGVENVKMSDTHTQKCAVKKAKKKKKKKKRNRK